MSGRTGRPLQALAVIAALMAGWLAGRWPLLANDFAAAVTSAQRAQLLADAGERAAMQLAEARLPLTVAANRIESEEGARPQAASPDGAAAGKQASADQQSPAPASVARPGASATPAQPRFANAGQVPAGVDFSRTPMAPIVDSPSPKLAAATLPAVVPGPDAIVRPATPQHTAFDLATLAYAAIAAGHRRVAAHSFDAALAAADGEPQAPAWAKQRQALGRRWSGSAYVFVRPGPATGFATASPATTAPLLGGSQSGAALAFALGPLARRPLDLTARATGSDSLDQHQAEAAVGVRWRLLPGFSLSAERLIALGPGGRHDWTLRLAGGHTVKIGPVAVDGYGEGGIVGITHPAQFAAAQARAAYPVTLTPAFTLAPGAGVWAGIQRDRLATTGRVDAGPSLRLHWARALLPVDVAVDYRRHLAGNAAPGSGAALTLSTGF